VGRVAYEKNIDFLLRMFVKLRAQRPDALFVIAGEGPAREHLVKLARELCIEDHVRFIGYLDRNTDLPNCYAAGDAFVFASRTETQGLVLLEAMAQGTPVVSTAELGTRSILTRVAALSSKKTKTTRGGRSRRWHWADDPRRAQLRAHAESWPRRRWRVAWFVLRRFALAPLHHGRRRSDGVRVEQSS
jgi:hypothetical protein